MNKVLHLFGEGTIGFDNRDRYTTRYAYDKNGNMLTLIRKGLQDDGSYGPIDNVSMQYEDNQLVRATDDVDGPFYAGAWHFRDGADAVEEYEYDENGNMTQDLNNGIENIEYNVLNLPKLITFANGGTIRYTYSATGEKLRAKYTMTSDSIIKTTDYCGRPHGTRWFEVNASKLGGNYFDKKYGRGASNYQEDSPDFFDINVFKKGGITRYINPRTNNYKQGAHPTSNARHTWWDFFIPFSVAGPRAFFGLILL